MIVPDSSKPGPRWWVSGDLDGFLGLSLDNLIQKEQTQYEKDREAIMKATFGGTQK